MLIDSIDANTIILLSCCCSVFLGFAGLDRYLVRRRAVATNRDHIARLQAIRINYNPRRSRSERADSRTILVWGTKLGRGNCFSRQVFSRRRILRDRFRSGWRFT